ncbi:acyl-CoA thioesterase [Candidatus Leptofilum sp.]|uniref:acyl-CoA thioesterase n=1 Tax=Candidatus Leptofilum sp. TaxID=3241576 RepID=UPI003B5998B5
MIDIAQIQQLACFHRATIPEAYLDVMGHMNIRHYMGLFDDAAWGFFAAFGMDEAYYHSANSGAFALEQHIRYLAEVHVGETVAIHTRVNGRSVKRIHFIHFMLNETTGKLAATLEVVGSHANLATRRTSPFPDHIAARLDQLLAEHNQLDWQAPLCGVMNP